MALEDAQQFFNDVNVKALRLHDYHDVVARPMCLSEIAERVASAREGPPASAPEGSDAPAPYPSLVAALEDVRLVWRNCKLYNKRQRAAPVRAAADAVAAAFEASLERRLGAPPPRLPMPREARRCPGAFEPVREEMDVPEAFGAYLPGEDLPCRMLDGFAVVVDDDADDDDDDEGEGGRGRAVGPRVFARSSHSRPRRRWRMPTSSSRRTRMRRTRTRRRRSALSLGSRRTDTSRSPTIRRRSSPRTTRRRTRRWRSSRRARRRRDPGSRCGSRRSRTGASTTRRRGARGW